MWQARELIVEGKREVKGNSDSDVICVMERNHLCTWTRKEHVCIVQTSKTCVVFGFTNTIACVLPARQCIVMCRSGAACVVENTESVHRLQQLNLIKKSVSHRRYTVTHKSYTWAVVTSNRHFLLFLHLRHLSPRLVMIVETQRYVYW